MIRALYTRLEGYGHPRYLTDVPQGGETVFPWLPPGADDDAGGYRRPASRSSVELDEFCGDGARAALKTKPKRGKLLLFAYVRARI